LFFIPRNSANTLHVDGIFSSYSFKAIINQQFGVCTHFNIFVQNLVHHGVLHRAAKINWMAGGFMKELLT